LAIGRLTVASRTRIKGRGKVERSGVKERRVGERSRKVEEELEGGEGRWRGEE